MIIYYLNAEFEVGKHKILKVWSEYVDRSMPEDSPKTNINVPYSVLEIDERYNRWLARQLLTNSRGRINDETLPDKYYVDSGGKLRDEFGNLVTINPNPQVESYKLSALYGLTQAQLETYINNNVTNLAQAKEFLKKLSAVVLWVVKQTKLDA
jgi:hypothetical protein